MIIIIIIIQGIGIPLQYI